MSDRDVGKVREFWDDRARRADVPTGEVTHRDVWQRWLEVETIRRYLRPSDRVLDVGCGNGFTTWRIAPLVREVVGIDFSREMVERARVERPADTAAPAAAAISFAVCDVTALTPSSFGAFDAAISERCLINLAGWPEQQQAIANIAAVVRPGGRFVFVEGSAEGRANLNRLRERVGLEAFPTVWHNRDFVEAELLPFLDQFFEIEERRHFGVYDFVSRVVHPMVVAPAPPEYDSRFNEVAARLARERQAFEDLSRVLFLVLKRKVSGGD